MRNLMLLLLVLSLISPMCFGQLPNLKYKEDGKFKIIQITDTHYIYANPESDVVSQLLHEVIDAEKPDLIVYTGDMVWKNEKTVEALDAVFAPVVERGIPWAYVFGNHDDEADMSRAQIMDYVTTKPYCMAVRGDRYLSGVGNYVLEVNDSRNEKIATVLYCLDSHAYSRTKGVEGYNWLQPDQIDWYRKQSAAYTATNEGTPLTALAFFHIPLSEYGEMTTHEKTELIGAKNETECSGKLNSGMFLAMRTAGDVMGVFTGHDHDNDYIGKWFDIYLAYGRYSGGKTVYNNLGENGCRVIELTEGVRGFSSYIRLLGGEKLYEMKTDLSE